MKDALAFVPMTLCLVIAGWIVVARGGDTTGWGWFLLLAVLFVPTRSTPHGPLDP